MVDIIGLPKTALAYDAVSIGKHDLILVPRKDLDYLLERLKDVEARVRFLAVVLAVVSGVLLAVAWLK